MRQYPDPVHSFKLDEEVEHTVIRIKRAAYTYDEIEKVYLHVIDDQSDSSDWQCPSMER